MSFLLVPALGAPRQYHSPPRTPYTVEFPPDTPPPSYPRSPPPSSNGPSRPPSRDSRRRSIEYNPAGLYTGDSRPQKRNNPATVDLLSEGHIAPATRSSVDDLIS
ncbi:hypothetical protein M378DRAFT_16304 [Amanita muscaria Koide BX008]|uniref:Uncharacterized protein n=1 Tax=Amanita muscaria (strain Koide BX008) TaxID=946122 RepID=A0A0C2S3U5_AMAMK|nr:hypothetical protein M378DRAFT_16304 [Amanita muscaria Koide BX008]